MLSRPTSDSRLIQTRFNSDLAQRVLGSGVGAAALNLAASPEQMPEMWQSIFFTTVQAARITLLSPEAIIVRCNEGKLKVAPICRVDRRIFCNDLEEYLRLNLDPADYSFYVPSNWRPYVPGQISGARPIEAKLARAWEMDFLSPEQAGRFLAISRQTMLSELRSAGYKLERPSRSTASEENDVRPYGQCISRACFIDFLKGKGLEQLVPRALLGLAPTQKS